MAKLAKAQRRASNKETSEPGLLFDKLVSTRRSGEGEVVKSYGMWTRRASYPRSNLVQSGASTAWYSHARDNGDHDLSPSSSPLRPRCSECLGRGGWVCSAPPTSRRCRRRSTSRGSREQQRAPVGVDVMIPSRSEAVTTTDDLDRGADATPTMPRRFLPDDVICQAAELSRGTTACSKSSRLGQPSSGGRPAIIG